MEFKFNDGGRTQAGYQGRAGDCVTRAIAIATGKPYQEVYSALWNRLKSHAANHRDKTARRIQRRNGLSGTTPRNGVSPKVWKPYLESLGWKWTPTMAIGQGCKVHLKADELPTGRLVVQVSKHLLAVIDGVVHDTFDDQRNGTRCVYGYYSQHITAARSKAHLVRFCRSMRCCNPLCDSSIEPVRNGWRRTERLFCCDQCKQRGYILRRAAELLEKLSDDKAIEALRRAALIGKNAADNEEAR